MKKVGVANLKARLSEYLRCAEQGEVIMVMDRDRPLARIVPLDQAPSGVTVRSAKQKLHDVTLPSPVKGTDSLADLLEERRDRG